MTIDPLSPRSMPNTRLFGPTASIEPMRTKLYQNAGLWYKKSLHYEHTIPPLDQILTANPSARSMKRQG